MQLENDVTAVTKTQWDDLHNWNAAVDDYKVFRRNRQARRGGGIALCVRECFDCLDLDSGDEKSSVYGYEWGVSKQGKCLGRSLLKTTHPMMKRQEYSISSREKSHNQ